MAHRPTGDVVATTRRYRPSTLVLETEFETADGVVRLIDCMALRASNPRIVRIVEGVRGTVPMSVRLNPRFDYGKTAPWILAKDQAVSAGAGPEAVELRADVPITSQDRCLEADFSVNAGERVCFVLTGYLSWEEAPPPIDALYAVAETEAWWRAWSGRSTYKGAWKDEVERSLITLKALTYAPTGGLVAAPTTSLPEFLGGVRNWDYRYCWIRDAALALDAPHVCRLCRGGDALARLGDPRRCGRPRTCRSCTGSQESAASTSTNSAGWRATRGPPPVRVGNAASGQLQLDVYGELADAIYRARRLGMTAVAAALDPTQSFVLWLERHWREPDDGIWEVRGPRRQFVHSKVMAWVAADRVVKMLQESGYKGAMDELLRMRDDIHEEVCRNGFDAERNTFTQY